MKSSLLPGDTDLRTERHSSLILLLLILMAACLTWLTVLTWLPLKAVTADSKEVLAHNAALQEEFIKMKTFFNVLVTRLVDKVKVFGILLFPYFFQAPASQ